MATKSLEETSLATGGLKQTASGTIASTDDAAGADPSADAGTEMRKKELIDLVVARSGIKKKDAKPVVEAMLAVLGQAIGDGRELNLQPLGKLRINRSVQKSNGRVVVCKLRQSLREPRAKVPLADAGD